MTSLLLRDLSTSRVIPTLGILVYRSTKKFDRDAFRNKLRLKLDEIMSKTYGTFEKNVFEVLNQHATEKEKSL